MSAEPMVSEREAVLREQAAFSAGASRAHYDRLHSERQKADYGMYAWQADAKLPYISTPERSAREAYPLPKVVRPRVVEWQNERGTTVQFRVRPSVPPTLEYKSRDFQDWQWFALSTWSYSAPLFALLADLMGRPTEEVEAEA